MISNKLNYESFEGRIYYDYSNSYEGYVKWENLKDFDIFDSNKYINIENEINRKGDSYGVIKNCKINNNVLEIENKCYIETEFDKVYESSDLNTFIIIYFIEHNCNNCGDLKFLQNYYECNWWCQCCILDDILDSLQ